MYLHLQHFEGNDSAWRNSKNSHLDSNGSLNKSFFKEPTMPSLLFFTIKLKVGFNIGKYNDLELNKDLHGHACEFDLLQLLFAPFLLCMYVKSSLIAMALLGNLWFLPKSSKVFPMLAKILVIQYSAKMSSNLFCDIKCLINASM